MYMECERLKRLIKSWYMQVQDEAMAPARMVDFMRTHLADCLDCMADPGVEKEVNRITEIILPPSKIPKAVRQQSSDDGDSEDESNEDQEEKEVDEDETNDVDEDDDEDEDDGFDDEDDEI